MSRRAAPKANSPAVRSSAIGLGIDAGGTRTRWALADCAGRILGQGSVAGLTALMMGNDAGRAQVATVLRELARDVHAGATGMPERVLAGFTGYSNSAPVRAALETSIAAAFGLAAGRVRVVGDVALAYLDSFVPGAGYLVYAGTGSIAAYIDAHGQMHRAGGRGSLLDDGGSGYWIAREAMRHIWRAEDERPGCWRESPMAACVFDHVGGSDWAHSCDFFYQRTRGQIGELALAVATAADRDAVALEILRRAGNELARLAQLMARRFGARPVALAGRVLQLHPAIEQSLCDALGAATSLRRVVLQAHETAARLAARDDPVLQVLCDSEPPVTSPVANAITATTTTNPRNSP